MIKLQLNCLHIRLDLTRQRRRLTWLATPSSIREVVSSAVKKADGLSIDNDTARLFIDNDHLLFRVTISVVSAWRILELITPSNTEGTAHHCTLLRANYILWNSYLLIEDNVIWPQTLIWRHQFLHYRGADKSLARPGRKQGTATKL